MTYRDPNQIARVPAIERAYSDWSEIPNNQDSEVSAELPQILENLEYAFDELCAAKMKLDTLRTDFGTECENAELDGLTPPTELTEDDSRKLRYAITSTREALKTLEALKGNP